jgi:hypothetical protein
MDDQLVIAVRNLFDADENFHGRLCEMVNRYIFEPTFWPERLSTQKANARSFFLTPAEIPAKKGESATAVPGNG